MSKHSSWQDPRQPSKTIQAQSHYDALDHMGALKISGFTVKHYVLSNDKKGGFAELTKGVERVRIEWPHTPSEFGA